MIQGLYWYTCIPSTGSLLIDNAQEHTRTFEFPVVM